MARACSPGSCGLSSPGSPSASSMRRLGYLVLAVDALGVDLEQDGDAVPGPLGDLGGRDSPVEPCRDAGVPEVVDALGQRGRIFAGGKCDVACLVPHATVGD